MNTINLDDGAKRRFALPAATVLGAYAALFFGFASPPSQPRPGPFRPHRPQVLPFELPVDLGPGPEGDNSAGEPSLRPEIQDVPNPLSPQTTVFKLPIIYSLPGSLVSSPGGPWSPGDSPPGGGPLSQPLDPALLDRQPQVISQQQPDYPQEAKMRNEGGRVVVEFVVDESGQVLNPHVIGSSDSIFEEPTLRAIGRWRFAPGTWHGMPVRFRLRVPVTFHLDE